MEGKKTFLDYIGQVFVIYGFSMLCMFIFTIIFGESAKEFSDLFLLGSQGLPVQIMGEFFIIDCIVVAWQWLLSNERILPSIPIYIRNIGIIVGVFITVVLFIIFAHWFPIGMWEAWAMFLLCFLLCAFVSTILSFVKTNIENEKLEKGLNRLKEKWKEEEKNGAK